MNRDALPWLLEPDNPCVRKRTLTDVLHRSTDDPEVLASHQAVAEQPLVRELLARQHPDGHWGDDETKPYTAQGAVTVLTLLHMLGVVPGTRTTAGCDSFLRFCQHACGGFSLNRTRRSGIFPCTTGEHLPFLVDFGLGNDPRVRRAFAFIVDDMSTPDALNCGRNGHRDCLWGAIAALNGLAVLPADMRSPQTACVVQRLADALLNARYNFQGEHTRWLTFGVPRGWDLLSALTALATHGYGHDPRFTPLLELVLGQQDVQGRWRCGSVSRTWPLEKRGQPSKWVTLDALKLLEMVRV